jgi:hypothetical protein
MFGQNLVTDVFGYEFIISAGFYKCMTKCVNDGLLFSYKFIPICILMKMVSKIHSGVPYIVAEYSEQRIL